MFLISAIFCNVDEKNNGKLTFSICFFRGSLDEKKIGLSHAVA
jgi:hypothetical protein